MTFFSNKQVCMWDGGYKSSRHEPASDATMGYSGATAAVLHDTTLVVGGRDQLGETLHEKSLVILFGLKQERILNDYDVMGTISRRIGHAVGALPSNAAWFVFGGELLADLDGGGGLFQPLGDLHRVTYANHVVRIERMQLKEGPTARSWHTLTTIRYRPPPDAPQALKGKQTTQPTIQVSELDDALLLLGGKDGGKDVWVFHYDKLPQPDDGDTTSDVEPTRAPKWSKLQTDGASPLPLAYHTCHALGEGTKVVVVGGVHLGEFVDTVSILDVLTGMWSTLAQSPSLQRSCHVMALVHVPTGIKSNTDDGKAAPDDHRISLLFPRCPVLPGPASNNNESTPPSAFRHGLDCFLIFGGITPDAIAPLDGFVVIDPIGGTVAQVDDGHLGIPSHMGHAIATSSDRRKLFVFGGTHASTHAWLDTMSCVDFWTYQHDPLPPPPLERIRTVEYPNGDVYLGELDAANLRHGLGRCDYATGDVYEGHWVEDAWAGDGRWESTGGDMYVGSFQGNERHGRGLWTCSPKAMNVSTITPTPRLIEISYDGPWERGLRHGSDGVVTYSNDAKLKGAWVDNVLQSSTIVIESYVDRDGKIVGLYEGAVDDSALHAPHGPGRFESQGYPKAGEMFSGSWMHGKRDGYVLHGDEGLHHKTIL
ncbi:hypothetical protein, variant 2 [Aphanomyces astaci]|uniref:Uncharacterized protein n=1 Tax=Aphanomyces astaci TaxID=112090 RepID=W4GDQ7_APHAT|nr:hypothetical protein, variant 1 [Aphanomyces astaci]XP_009833198.1 hypothetical protein, variant 2 [Aphanomyces astaci]ETV77410.1 hypothetical protein, variant 1 [Aphanomyces astaci]ETV77411.1 hypothetical protein, variant 2 [Aphanomyces astaci]|eukprot:XP_009833197.1 hypothetical protein, variant 1 [Aphanomyces astaci]